ncbi:MAG: hypothetical protein K5893_00445 [Prevotella sp.]|nr:hypothetical protein [Prevotella sp.]
MQRSRVCFSIWLLSVVVSTTALAQQASPFCLMQKSDSLSVLSISTDSTHSEWPLSYPVYRFCTGDVDGDGSEDALVGVVKSTRFFPEKGRRIFIFKNFHGLVRPLWMGSRLGGKLEDFKFANGKVTALERTDDDRYVVADYEWKGFGMSFVRFHAKNITREQAIELFNKLTAL